MRALHLIQRRVVNTVARTTLTTCSKQYVTRVGTRAFQLSKQRGDEQSNVTVESAQPNSNTTTTLSPPQPVTPPVHTPKYEFVDFSPARPELYIDTVAGLAALIKDHLEPFDAIGFDTEFLTALVYRPTLHILQVSSPTIIAAIDYQAFKGQTIKPLLELLNRKVVILHSCQSDLAILSHIASKLNITPQLPPRIFDTQIAAAMLGYGDMIGYAALLNRLFGIELSKKDTMTDWSRRPLTASQLQYAWNDVRHLHSVYQRLSEELAATGRTEWAAAELALLSNPQLFASVVPEHAWRTVWMGKKLADHSVELSVLASVAEWRETLAATKDMMPSIVLRHEVLYALAIQMPRTLEELESIQGIKPWVLRKHTNDLLRAVARGKENHRKLRHRVPHKQGGRLKEGLFNLLSSRTAALAAKHSISQFQLAPRQELFDLASVSQEAVEQVLKASPDEFTPAPMVCNFFGVKHDQLPLELSTAPASHFDDALHVEVNEQAPLHRSMSLADEVEMLKKLKVLTGWRREMIGHDLLAVVQGHSLTWNQQTEQAGLSGDQSVVEVSQWIAGMSPSERKVLTHVIDSINAGLTHIHSAATDSAAPSNPADQVVLSELQSVLKKLMSKQISVQSANIASSHETADAVSGQSVVAASA